MNADTMVPYRVTHRVRQTSDSVTLRLAPLDADLPQCRPGQFMMLYAFGIGEIAISVSGADGVLEHTIRAVGAVSRALHDAPVDGIIWARGPFGTGWDLPSASGRDIVVIAGGVGMAPLRPVVVAARADRARYGRVTVVVGARRPEDMLFRSEQEKWKADGIEVIQTVDIPSQAWHGRVGFVTEPLAHLDIRPDNTTAFLCGPEPMMRYCALALMRKGMPDSDIRLSLERNMQCGNGVCGHCQLGPILVCRDGPVVDYRTAADLLMVREL